jgi:CRP/FNR family transcriptional regulator, cyclic AMP receptor protein
MHHLDINLPEIFGYVAAGLVLATFSMRTMLPLRILGISSNIAFMTYGYLADLHPVLILHALLLPLNIYRFIEMRRLVHEFEGASGAAKGLDALLPYASSVALPAGATIFQKGDVADDMYVIISGRVRLPEFDLDIGPGETVGELSMFSPSGRRMTAAECSEDCSLQRITREKLRELVYQNPRIGFHLISVVTARFIEDVDLLRRELAASEGTPR